jgi:glycosyltransferase involved in cell wall biosynthesis
MIMNVLIFTSLYPNNIWPHHGVFVKERMTKFAQLEGCKAKVVAPVPYFPPLKISRRAQFSQIVQQESIEGLEVYHPRYFMIPKVGMVLQGFLMFLFALPCVQKIQSDFHFDLIDAHYVYPDGFAAVLLGSFFKKPVVVSARGSDINLFARFPLIRRFLQYTLTKADRVIAVCKALKDAMVQLDIPGEKITIIPNGVDTRKFFPYPKEQARYTLGLPHDKRIILSVGGLIPRKGFDLLIKALKMLSSQLRQDDLYLVIVGEGESRPVLEQLITELDLDAQVRLVGSVSHQELYLWYSAADLFCLASSREGWPNVVLEALASGIPVVATDVWGVPEIIGSESLGVLTKRSVWDIAESIASALHKPWRSDTLVAYARAHTWDQVALAVLRVFESALSRELGMAGKRRVIPQTTCTDMSSGAESYEHTSRR